MNVVYKRLSLLLAAILMCACWLAPFSTALAEESAPQDIVSEAEKDPYANAIPTLPTLSLTVEYEKPTPEGTLTGMATIVCNPPKSADAAISDAKDVSVTIELTDELRLGEGCSPEFSIGMLAANTSYAFPFTLEFDPRLAKKQSEAEKIIPVVTITALSEEIGGCRYTCALDVTPEANLILCSINATTDALNAWIMDESADRLEEAFEALRFEGEEFSIQRFDMDISDPAALPFSAVQEAMAAIETDENDLICLYLNAYAPSGKDSSASAFASILNGKEVETDYGELCAWMEETLECRVVLLIDCETAPAAIRAASALDPDYFSAVGVDLHADTQRRQSGGYRIQGLLAQTVLDYIESAAPSASLTDLTSFFGGGHTTNRFFKGMTGTSLDAVSCGNPESPVFALDPEYHSDVWMLAVKEENLEWISPFGNEVILTTTMEIIDQANVLSRIVIPTIHIPGNAELADEINSLMMECVDNRRKTRDEMASGTIDPDSVRHQADMSVTECFSTDRALSFTLASYDYYSGAAHGLHGVASYNYDLQSGNPLSICDMLDPGEPNAQKRLSTLIGNQLSLHYGDMLWSSGQDLADAVLAGEMGNWAMNAEGLYVFFNEYEAGPYAVGHAGITIPYAQLEYVFDEDFILPATLPEGQGEIINSTDPRISGEDFRNFGTPQASAFLVSGSLSQVLGTDAEYGSSICFYASRMTDAYAWLPDDFGEICIAWKDKDGAHTAYAANG